MTKKTVLTAAGTLILAAAITLSPAAAFAVEPNTVPTYNETTESYELQNYTADNMTSPVRYGIQYESLKSTITMNKESVVTQEYEVVIDTADRYANILMMRFPQTNAEGIRVQHVITPVEGENLVSNIQSGVDHSVSQSEGVPYTQLVITNNNPNLVGQPFKFKVETYNAYNSSSEKVSVPVFMRTHSKQLIYKAEVDATSITAKDGTISKTDLRENIIPTFDVKDANSYLPTRGSHSTDATSYAPDNWATGEAEEILSPAEIAAKEKADKEASERAAAIFMFTIAAIAATIVSVLINIPFMRASRKRIKAFAGKKWYEITNGTNALEYAQLPGDKTKTVQMQYGTMPGFMLDFDDTLFTSVDGSSPVIGFTFNEPTMDDGSKIGYHLYPFLSNEQPKKTAVRSSALALLYGCIAKGALVLEKQKSGGGGIMLPPVYDADKIASLNTAETVAYEVFVKLLVEDGKVSKKFRGERSLKGTIPAWFTEAQSLMIKPENSSLIDVLVESRLKSVLDQQVAQMGLFEKTKRSNRGKELLMGAASVAGISGAFALLNFALASTPFANVGWFGIGATLVFGFVYFLDILTRAKDVEDVYRTAKGTAILTRMQMYRNYLNIVDSNSRYSLEKNDINATVLPWSIVFNFQNIWADVFAAETEDPNIVKLGNSELPAEYLKRIIGAQIAVMELETPSKTSILSKDMF